MDTFQIKVDQSILSCYPEYPVQFGNLLFILLLVNKPYFIAYSTEFANFAIHFLKEHINFTEIKGEQKNQLVSNNFIKHRNLKFLSFDAL